MKKFWENSSVFTFLLIFSIFILFVLVFWFVQNQDIQSSLWNKNHTQDVNLEEMDEYLYSLKREKNLKPQIKEEYIGKMDNIKSKTPSNLEELVEKSKTFEKLWYLGRAGLVYQKYLKTHTGIFSVYKNAWDLFKQICELADKNKKKYCEQAIKYYYKLVKKYDSLEYTKSIINILIVMENYETAKKVYNYYLKQWGKADRSLEKKLNIDK